MGRLTEWIRDWRRAATGRRRSETATLAVERLEAREMLASGVCLVVDFTSPQGPAETSVAMAVELGGAAPGIDQSSAADSSRFIYLDDFAEELGNVFDLEDDDLWWMDSDVPWGSQST